MNATRNSGDGHRLATGSSLVRSCLVAIPLATLACGAGSSNTGPGATAEAGSSADGGSSLDSPLAAPGQLGLRIEQARQHRANGEPDTEFLLAVTVANGEGGAPVPLAASSFKLHVKSGLLKSPTSTGSSADVRWVDGKTADVTDSLAGGASYGPWTLSFSIDASKDAPIELTFETPGVTLGDATVGELRKVATRVVLEECTECRDYPKEADPTAPPVVCTYLDRDPSHCGACTVDGTSVTRLAPYVGMQGTCNAGAVVCPGGLAACTTEKNGYSLMGCFNLATEYWHCGKCGRSCEGNEHCVANECIP